MSKDWTKEELERASKAMIESGHMGYDEFCEKLRNGEIVVEYTELENDNGNKDEQS